MSSELERLVASLGDAEPQPVYLIEGDRVLAEPAAERLAAALAERSGTEPSLHRRPARLADLVADLRTFSLFEPAKIVVAIDSAALADRSAAAGLLDDAATVLPVERTDAEPTSRERHAALRLMRALRLFQLDPYAGAAAELLAQLPKWALQGAGGKGRRRRPAARAEKLRDELAALLELARGADLSGYGETDSEDLAAVVRDGLPPGHTLILAESSVAADHPVVEALSAAGAVVRLGGVEAARRGGWQGLDRLVEELERQTGSPIAPPALAELARRTLRGERRSSEVDAESTGRFAAEYRKLSDMAGGGRITAELVEQVEDRGRDEVWGILDAIGAGEGKEALAALGRRLSASDDLVSERLAFFGLLATFCRQLAAIGALLEGRSLPAGERHYTRFRDRIAPRLQAELDGSRPSPLAGIHPFRLHRAYLAASRMPPARLARLPARVLETELRLKGESGAPDAALSQLVAEVAAGLPG